MNGLDGQATVSLALPAGWRTADVLDALVAVDSDLAEGAAVRLCFDRHGEDAQRMNRLLRVAEYSGFHATADTGGATLVRLHRPRWRPKPIGVADRPGVQALFRRVFGHEMSDALWSWKYGDGRGAAIGVWEGGELVAHYGGMRRNVLMFGRQVTAAQSGDVMVAPSARGTLSRRSPLFLAAAAYLDTQVGDGNPSLLGFGFPNRRAWMAPRRLGLYGGPVAKMLELSWGAASGMPRPLSKVRRLDTSRPLDREALNECWRAMAKSMTDCVLGTRDIDWLDHRYMGHPHHGYQFFLVCRRLTGEPMGAFVIRLQPQESRCELVDVIAPPDRMSEVVMQARRISGSLGVAGLWLWCTDMLAGNVGRDACIKELDISVPANAWSGGPAIDPQIGRWWLTGGDTDFH